MDFNEGLDVGTHVKHVGGFKICKNLGLLCHEILLKLLQINRVFFGYFFCNQRCLQDISLSSFLKLIIVANINDLDLSKLISVMAFKLPNNRCPKSLVVKSFHNCVFKKAQLLLHFFYFYPIVFVLQTHLFSFLPKRCEFLHEVIVSYFYIVFFERKRVDSVQTSGQSLLLDVVALLVDAHLLNLSFKVFKFSFKFTVLLLKLLHFQASVFFKVFNASHQAVELVADVDVVLHHQHDEVLQHLWLALKLSHFVIFSYVFKNLPHVFKTLFEFNGCVF